MNPRRSLALIRALFAYAVVAVAFNWPLPLHLATQLTGRITGDTGVYVWNLWLFRHEIVAHHQFPLFTQEILSLSPPVDLSLHNYTLFANVLAFPLIPILGVTASFNVIYLALATLTAWTMFLLARSVIGRDGEAWLAGLMFGFSPFLIARSEAHFSLVAAAPLPIFLLSFMRAVRDLSVRHAAIAGGAIAWAAICDPYYGIFCILIAGCYLAARHVRVRVGTAPPTSPFTKRIVTVMIGSAIAIITTILATGGLEWRWLGIPIAMKSLYTPVLLLVILTSLRAVIAFRPTVIVKGLPSARVAFRLAAATGLVCAAILSPILYALGSRLADGGALQGPVFWRNSPSGVDFLALFTPNPNHAWFGGPWRDWLTLQPGGYVENAASLTIVGVAVLAIAVWRYRFRPPRAWTGLTVFFAAIALGPFVHVGGVNTYIPGPWAVLRYVPLFSATRTPARFAVVAMLAFAMLFGLALARIARGHPARRRLILVCAGLALVFELSPYPRQTFPATVPDIYATIANDPRDMRVLTLPFGIRDGESSEGNFNASTQFYQTFHQKQLYGGYLSRITRAEVERQRQSPTVEGLMHLSAGGTLEPARFERLKARGPGFVERTHLGYVVMNTRRTPPALRQFAMDAFGLVKIGERDGDELYTPTRVSAATTVRAAPVRRH